MTRFLRGSISVVVVAFTAGAASAQDIDLETVYQGKTLREWGADLESDDPAVSENASIHLIMLGKRAVPLLNRALGSQSAKARGTAGQALSMLGTKAASAAPTLTASLETEGDEEARAWLASALGDVGGVDPAAIAVLRTTLTRGGEFPRRMAAQSLGKAGPKAAPATPELIALLDGTSSPLQQQVLATLGAIGEGAAAAVPELARLLDEGDPSGREALVSVLGRIGAPALSVLEKALSHDDPRVRRRAAGGLARIGPAAAASLPALLEMARADADAYARHAAVGALGSVGGARKDVVDALIAALSEDALQEAAAKALGGLGVNAKPAVPALRKLLGSKTRRTRTLVAFALLEIGAPGPDLVEPLAEAVASRAQPQYRVPAAKALGELGPAASEAVPILEKALKRSWDPALKKEIAAALAKIGEGPTETATPAVPTGDPKRAAVLVAEYVEDTQGRERYRLASALVEEGPKAAFPALGAAIEATGDPRLKNALLELVQRFRDVSPSDGALLVPVTAKILGGDDQVFVRRAAARALGALGSADGVPALVDAVKRQTDSLIVDYAAAALGRLGSKGAAAAPALSAKITETLDRRQAPRAPLVSALGGVGGERDVVLLLRVLREQPKASGHAAVQALHALGPKAAAAAPALGEVLRGDGAMRSFRQAAAAALEDMGPGAAGAKDALLDLLEAEKDRRVLNSVIAAIGKFPLADAEGAAPKLIAQITGHGLGEAMAARVLSDLGARSPATIAKVGAALEGADPTATFNLLALLGGTRDAAAAPFLSEALQRDEERLRVLAAKALWQLGPKATGAVPALRKALRDPSLDVRLRAAAASLRARGRLKVPDEAPSWDVEAVARQITKNKAVLEQAPSLARASGLGRALAEGYGLATKGANASDLSLLELLVELFWEHDEVLVRAAKAALK